MIYSDGAFLMNNVKTALAVPWEAAVTHADMGLKQTTSNVLAKATECVILADRQPCQIQEPRRELCRILRLHRRLRELVQIVKRNQKFRLVGANNVLIIQEHVCKVVSDTQIT